MVEERPRRGRRSGGRERRAGEATARGGAAAARVEERPWSRRGRSSSGHGRSTATMVRGEQPPEEQWRRHRKGNKPQPLRKESRAVVAAEEEAERGRRRDGSRGGRSRGAVAPELEDSNQVDAWTVARGLPILLASCGPPLGPVKPCGEICAREHTHGSYGREVGRTSYVPSGRKKVYPSFHCLRFVHMMNRWLR
ncbi:hypothetical protein BS78_01G469200 [Paspalum vaginatum]|nr:hypothetical protein BS78_01G469200 [Paspalum vaginatum]